MQESTMSSSMSTPIQQLPKGAAPSADAKLDDDPEVANMIQELTRERQQPTQQAAGSVAPQIHYNQQQPMIVTNVSPATHGGKRGWFDDLWNPELAQRAVIVAIIAFLLFYPHDLSALYAKVPVLSNYAHYDRFIRVIMLTVVLYCIFLKLDL